jgi:hypothetical protein
LRLAASLLTGRRLFWGLIVAAFHRSLACLGLADLAGDASLVRCGHLLSAPTAVGQVCWYGVWARYRGFTMISGLRPVLVSKAPTAQAVLPAADMPPRILSPFPGLGAATCCQPLPVLRATSVSWLPLA